MLDTQTIALWAGAADLIERGGVVMWPLLGLSVLAVALLLERGAFFLRAN